MGSSTQSDKIAHTLSLRCTRQLLDGMTAMVWEFGDNQSLTRRAWNELGDVAAKNRRRKDATETAATLIPYSIAVTVLKQITDGYVYLDKYLRFMVALNPIDAETLRTVFAYLDGIVNGVPLDEVPFQGPSKIADGIAGTTARELSLADNILGHAPDVPPNPDNWAYEAVKWHIAKRLAAVSFVDREFELREADDGTSSGKVWQPTGNDAEVRYRPTSTGDLLAWDNPIGPAFINLAHPVNLHDAVAARSRDISRTQAQYAMSKVSIKMVTHPGESAPALLFDAHTTRVNDTVIFANTVTVDQGVDRPLLEMSTAGRGIRRPYRYALEILAKMDADRSVLDSVEQRVAHERTLLDTIDDNGKRVSIVTPPPDRIRPTMPRTDNFAVGTGAGLHHLTLLRECIERAFGQDATFIDVTLMDRIFGKQAHLPPNAAAKAEQDAKKKRGEYVDLLGKPSPESIRRSIESEGYTTLRILCLWYRDETRIRMIHGLAHSFGLPTADLDPGDGELLNLAPGLDAAFCYAGEVLEPGPGAERAAGLEKITSRFTGDGIKLAAWCETEIPVAGEEHEGMSRAEKEQALEKIDAKHPSRRKLAQDLIPNQWLVGRTYDQYTKTHTTVTVPENASEDYSANMAIMDLYRSCGVVDDRFERALYPARDSYLLPRTAFVGFHVRKQAASTRYKGQPQRIICAGAIIPSEEPGGVWRMLGWSNIHPQWEPYALAQSHFHATDYPLHAANGDGEQDRWAQAGRDIQQALIGLHDELDDLPYAMIVDGHGSRRIWPGLQNGRQNRNPDPTDPRLWLPSTGLQPSYQPVGIIRMNCMQEEMFRLTHYTHISKTGTITEPKTTTLLAYPPERPDGHPWFLFTVPRNYGRKRHGQWKTRWRADPGVASKNADERRQNELNSPWYCTTTREINPMCTRAGYDRQALAVAAARLSHQALSWSDRTRYPAPLHAALQMDLDHPQFRRSKPTDPESAAILQAAQEGE